MSEIDEISARLTVLETVVRQLSTHMAVRDDDPPLWVRTRKTLAMSAIDAKEATQDSARLHGATEALFDQAELVAHEYRPLGRVGTRGTLLR